MPWMECDRMSQREEFVLLADREGATLAELCRRFGISRKTGYKWLERFREGGFGSLGDRSHAAHHQPRRIAEDLEQRWSQQVDATLHRGRRSDAAEEEEAEAKAEEASLHGSRSG